MLHAEAKDNRGYILKLILFKALQDRISANSDGIVLEPKYFIHLTNVWCIYACKRKPFNEQAADIIRE